MYPTAPILSSESDAVSQSFPWLSLPGLYWPSVLEHRAASYQDLSCLSFLCFPPFCLLLTRRKPPRAISLSCHQSLSLFHLRLSLLSLHVQALGRTRFKPSEMLPSGKTPVPSSTGIEFTVKTRLWNAQPFEYHGLMSSARLRPKNHTAG